MVYKWIDSIQRLLYPARCRLCLAPGADDLELCRGCIADLPRVAVACRRCGRDVPAAGTPVCGRCLADPPAFDRCHALYVYAPPVDFLIHRIKYAEDLALARTLGRLLAERIAGRGMARPDRVVPVPLHRTRLGERGYNQALELARPLRQLGLRLDPRCCVRTRPTDAQAGLPAAGRRRNVRGAFEVVHDVGNDHVALVDDVLTTGSTLAELATTLKRAGARRVDVWVVARTLRDRSGP